MESGKKHCKRCDETKPHQEFYKNKRKKDGLQVYCKPCMKKENQVNYQKHKESWNKRSNEYTKTDKWKKYHTEYEMNKYNTNPEHRRKCIERNVINERKRLKQDPIFKLTKTLRSRIKATLKNQNAKKNTTTMDLIGETPQFVRNYLALKFTEGMSWENHGRWHIDHIKPCCSFDLTNPEEQKKCFHYTNLQPLWAKDNLQKGGQLK